MIFKCYDTCSLLEQAGHLFDGIDFTLVISSIVLEELEHIKTSRKDPDVKFSARKVLQDLDSHYGEYEIVIYNDAYGQEMLANGIELTNDAKIIACARAFRATHPNDIVVFVTNDLLCKHIASMYFNVEVAEDKTQEYDGYKEVYLEAEGMDYFYSNPNLNMFDLYVNQYLLIYDRETGECVDQLCWTGEEYRHLTYGNFSSRHFGDVKPMKNDVY